MDDKRTLERARQWIYRNTVNGYGIAVTSRHHNYYPEVTGYFIPSLLRIGEIDLAKNFAKSLLNKQHESGAWHDIDESTPYVFDTCQILKGLLAIRDYIPEVDDKIIKAIDWVFSNQTSKGRIVQPNTDLWGKDDSWNNELIHIYCISPILEAAKVFGRSDWEDKANRALDYYINTYKDRIVNYTMFSHFYAYVMEGLVDCGRLDVALEAMDNFAKYQKKNGAIPALNNVNWVCSTAMFQFAITWYKLGKRDRADQAYEYACSLQNKSGGWYGCYNVGIKDILRWIFKKERLYFKLDEISWAVKFFIDAKYYRNYK